MRGVPHPDELRAAVVTALLEGQSLTLVAERFKVSKATVSQWRDAAGIGLNRVQPEKGAEIGELVTTYLTQTLRTLAVQAELCADKAWLQKYSPAEVATLFGVMSDKGFRLLEAIQAASSEPSPESGV